METDANERALRTGIGRAEECGFPVPLPSPRVPYRPSPLPVGALVADMGKRGSWRTSIVEPRGATQRQTMLTLTERQNMLTLRVRLRLTSNRWYFVQQRPLPHRQQQPGLLSVAGMPSSAACSRFRVHGRSEGLSAGQREGDTQVEQIHPIFFCNSDPSHTRATSDESPRSAPRVRQRRKRRHGLPQLRRSWSMVYGTCRSPHAGMRCTSDWHPCLACRGAARKKPSLCCHRSVEPCSAACTPTSRGSGSENEIVRPTHPIDCRSSPANTC